MSGAQAARDLDGHPNLLRTWVRSVSDDAWHASGSTSKSCCSSASHRRVASVGAGTIVCVCCGREPKNS
jgi:transposase-like protein